MTRVLDRGDAAAFLERLHELRPGYVPEWEPGERGADAAILEIAARDLQAVARRLEQAPAKNKLAFLEMMGVRVVPAQPARAPIVVRLAEDAADVRIPAGTRVAAPPPPDGGGQVTFETERSAGAAAAPLREVVSLWPGRDQYIDHSADASERLPFRPWDPLELENTPHALYLAHDRLLALAGESTVTVTFELTTGSSQELDVRWEYWDGKVWRPFRDMRPACSDEEAQRLDGTRGLRFSGVQRLEAECAKTARTQVNGVDGFWIRGRLEAALPANPERVLPEVESIRLSTQLTSGYTEPWLVSERPARSGLLADGSVRTDETLAVRVVDAAGVPLPGVFVEGPDDGSPTLDGGDADLTVVPEQRTIVAVTIGGVRQEHELLPPAGKPAEVTFALDMSPLDKAIADTQPVDVTKPFFPLGVQPQPGSAFYFSHEEAFAKPGARLRLFVQPALTPQDELAEADAGDGASTADTELDHLVSWDYWNGSAWSSLLVASSDDGETPEDLREAGMIDLVVPADLAPTTVADQEGRWMRVSLVSGGYGVIRTVTVEGVPVSFYVPRPPSLADMRVAYAWEDGPHPPDHVLAHNDFAYADRTAEATWPGAPFQPFVPVADATPALYLGFDGPLPVDNLGLWVDVDETLGETEGPTLVWEYSDGFAWQRLTVGDETHDLRLSGIVGFVGPEDMGPLARFGTARHWLRARLNEDGPPGSPALEALLPNAIWVLQRQTVVDEPIATSTGRPDQLLRFRQAPVLPGQRVEVLELSGPRANVEWRILAGELLADPSRAIAGLEALLAAEGDPGDVESGPLRLRRDRFKRVSEVWVLWEERPSLFSSAPTDRHYALDHAHGRILFGDGEHGRVPPPGANIVARRYQTGGGQAGNVDAGAINQPLGPIGGMEEIFNPAPAEGGADAETNEQVAERGPASVRHRGRAVSARDYETLAREASPSVGLARAIPGRDPHGVTRPGWITLVIVPHSAAARPYPSFGLRQSVRRFIEARAPADLAGAGRILVTGPDYQPVDVTATVAPLDPSEAGAVERAAHAAVTTFLHPLRGGPAGSGWQPGQAVQLSDLAAVLERVAGVDYPTELELARHGVAQGERVEVPAGRIAVAGEVRIRIVEGT
jgi:hypothetical protein